MGASSNQLVRLNLVAAQRARGGTRFATGLVPDVSRPFFVSADRLPSIGSYFFVTLTRSGVKKSPPYGRGVPDAEVALIQLREDGMYTFSRSTGQIKSDLVAPLAWVTHCLRCSME